MSPAKQRKANSAQSGFLCADYEHANLAIIDMQKRFPSSQNEETIGAVLKLIAYAIARQWTIIVIEFYAHGPTDERIMSALKGYSNIIVEYKFDEDGSQEIWELCVEHELSGNRFVFCGVNTHSCVQDTVSGLARILPDSLIEVVQDACNCETGNDWRRFHRARNVVLRSMV